ncbi:MAG TPA: ABC transporter substrate-binding protein [Candidatus Thermoplasmatota archaeon]|nr:ABC transporter substrate-binding protein [Candidatus Thermoplasmatota archaeon]
MRLFRTSSGFPIVTVALLVGVALAGCTTPGPGPGPGGDGQPIRIGTLLPMSGGLEQYGPSMRNGAILAMEQINAAGGVLGRQIQLFHENDQTNNDASVAAARTLVNTHRVVAVIGPAGSPMVIASGPTMWDNRILHISPSATSPQLTELARDGTTGGYWFRTAPDDGLQGKVAAAYAIAKGYARVNILASNNAYGLGLAEAFKASFENQSSVPPRVSNIVTYTDDPIQASYSAEVAQAFTGAPNAVFFVGYPGAAAVIMQDWWANRQLPGYDAQWIWSEGVYSQALVDDMRGRDIDVRGVTGTAPQSPGDREATFNQAYRARFNEAPGLFASNTYDAVMVIALAIQKAGSTDGPAVRDAVRTIARAPGQEIGPGQWAQARQALANNTDINYQGASNEADFDQNGDVASAYIIWVVNDEWRLTTLCAIPGADVLTNPVPIADACLGQA